MCVCVRVCACLCVCAIVFICLHNSHVIIPLTEDLYINESRTLPHINKSHCQSAFANGGSLHLTKNYFPSDCGIIHWSRSVCCSVLQCVAVCCSVLQCAAVCCSVLQCVAVCCSVLQFVAVCYSVLQYVAACCSVLQYGWIICWSHSLRRSVIGTKIASES